MRKLLFLLLLRLSPPPQRNQPFSLRPPPSTAQSPPAIPPSGSSAYHPASPSAGRHYRRASQRTVLSLNTAGPASYRDHHILDLDLDEEAGEPDDPEEDFTSDSASSISASSIIDLPPALSPSRILPPTSLSLDRGLNLAALDGSPIIGPLVRRTRSAKSLGRRILSGMSGQVERGEEEGYGTFEASS